MQRMLAARMALEIAQDGLFQNPGYRFFRLRAVFVSSPGGSTHMDGILGVLQFAVDGLTQQQQAIAGNLANSETPGYKAQTVSFEQSLQQALGAQNGGTATVTTATDPTLPSFNGNNVDTSSQLVAAEQNTLQYKTTVQMLNDQFYLIQGAAGGSWS